MKRHDACEVKVVLDLVGEVVPKTMYLCEEGPLSGTTNTVSDGGVRQRAEPLVTISRGIWLHVAESNSFMYPNFLGLENTYLALSLLNIRYGASKPDWNLVR